MTVRQLLAASAVASACALSFPAAAHADDKTVTYEVTSSSATTANVQYWDGTEMQPADGVTLPWKVDAPVGDLSRGAKTPNHAEIKADWRSTATPDAPVTVRIYLNDKVVCQSTTGTGEADCNYATFSSYLDTAPPKA
ncbi:MmpS family transport accessory protein [Mycobacteroides chelonae]|uniref:MmpS family transport accessory protein n=1 Tax=Mycobacteroides chelonae TaxID=1774 RepID=UPI001C2BF3E3|nr:MmpS family transport accessory protein [Mycobacteroides chelonae]MBV0918563.1 MmpS family protein [Mycobacteroides chelonae]